MAKATHAQELTTGTSSSYTEHEATDPALNDIWRIPRAVLGGEQSSDGNSLSISQEQTTMNDAIAKPNLPELAPTTESPSSLDETPESFTAPSTGTATPVEANRSAKRPAKTTKKAAVKAVDPSEFD